MAFNFGILFKKALAPKMHSLLPAGSERGCSKVRPLEIFAPDLAKPFFP
jgi:hypothetical protein